MVLESVGLGFIDDNNKHLVRNGRLYPYDVGKKYCSRCRKYYTTKRRNCAKCSTILRSRPRNRKSYVERHNKYDKLPDNYKTEDI